MRRNINIFNLLIVLISFNIFAGDMHEDSHSSSDAHYNYDSDGCSLELWDLSDDKKSNHKEKASSHKMKEQFACEKNTLSNVVNVKRKLIYQDPQEEKKLDIQEKKKKIFQDIANQQNNFISNANPDVQNIGKENNNKQPRKSLNISPIKNKKDGGLGRDIRKNAVYIFTADVSVLPSHAERIDFREIYDEDVDDENERINRALLHIEKTFLKWNKDHPDLKKKTIYLGLAENASNRFQRHKADCAHIKNGQEINFCESSKKVEWVSYAWRQNCDVQQSSLVYGITLEYLPVVEAFLGELFDAKDAGVTILANGWAYDVINAYRQSKLYKSWAKKNKIKKRKSVDKGSFFHSPTKTLQEAEKNAVYGHFFCKPNEELSFLPPRTERINFGRVYKEKNKNLDGVLLHIEEKIRTWIKKDQRFADNGCYIGETKNTQNRGKGHKTDISKIASDVDNSLFEANRKLENLEATWPKNADIRMSPLIWNIKSKKHRHIVEVLVAELLYARGKASCEHGTLEAYAYVQKYFLSAARKQRLEAVELSDICENLRERARDVRFYND